MLETAYATYGTGRFRLYTRRLERGGKAVATSIALPMPRTVQLSPDGSRVTLDGTQFEVATGRVVRAAAPVPVFPSRGIIGEVGQSRLLRLTPDRGRLQIVDRTSGKIEVEVSGVSTPIIGRNRPMVRYSENATFIGLGRIDGERRLVLWDARTGAKRPLPM
jgi:hypothetical protein